MKEVLLIRHLESQKNLEDRFSASPAHSQLTISARRVGRELKEALEHSRFGPRPGIMISSPAVQAIQTAQILATAFRCKIETVDGLASFRMGALSDITESDAINTHPNFMRQLKLYRVGVFNSYRLQLPANSEDPRKFERRIWINFEKTLLKHRSKDTILCVLSRSAITAILLKVARETLEYPRNFYGYIELATGSISRLRHKRGRWSIEAVNVQMIKVGD